MRCGVRPDTGWERIRPVLPDTQQRALLGLVRADRFSYAARWSAQDNGASFEPVTGTA